jgi:peptidoglycan/LPS O-acetylase OafA/YrhL
MGVIIRRLDSLTGLRFVAAILVFGFHGTHFTNGGELGAFSSGMVGVSLFYILSGFVMSWTARNDDSPWNFYRRRFARIYPAYAVAWLASIALLALGPGVAATDFVPLTLLQSWFPMEAVYFAGSAVFWSLSCEAFFYLVFPFIQKVLSKVTTRTVVLIGFMAICLSIAIAVIAIPAGENDFTRWLIIIFPPLRLLEFIVGMVIGTVMSRGWRSPVPVWLAVTLVIGGVAGSHIAPYSLSRYAITLIPLTLLITSLATSDLSGKWSVVSHPIAIRLGAWSYAFYLVHVMVLNVSFALFASFGLYSAGTTGFLFWSLILLAFALSIMSACLLHTLVEVPAERFLRNRMMVQSSGG